MNISLNIIKNGSRLLPIITFFYLWMSQNVFLSLILFVLSFAVFSINSASDDHFARILTEKKITTLNDATKIMFKSKVVIILGALTIFLEIIAIIYLLFFLYDSNALFLLLLNIGALIYQIVLGLFNKDILLKYAFLFARKIRK